MVSLTATRAPTQMGELSLRVWPANGGWEYDVRTSGPPPMRSTGFCASRQNAVESAIGSLRDFAGLPEPGDPRMPATP